MRRLTGTDAGVQKRAKMPRGIQLLHDPVFNKGTAFTEAERDALGLRGLLPPRVQTMEEQKARVMENFHLKPNDLERYIYLTSLMDRNETLFYRLLVDNLEKLMPVIYTPTVGQACQMYGKIFRRSRGLYLSWNDKGQIKRVLKNWPRKDVRVIVVTDGERILGLGDLGAGGMGIPVGKLALYTACAGIHPGQCLPVTLDVGTNNEALLQDPHYLGLRQRRVCGPEYDAFVEEFVDAVKSVFPRALLQLEDFGNANAFRLLEKYKDRICCFDDDVQGTAAVALAGILAAMRLSHGQLEGQKFLFMGAGEAGLGIGHLIVAALKEAGIPEDEAKRRCWYVDSKGLIVKERTDLSEHKKAFAHDYPFRAGLQQIIEDLKPTALIGAAGRGRLFTQPIIEMMARLNSHPLIFALSNPTSKAECTAEEAYRWSGGRAIFASGSPFEPVQIDGRTFIPGQGNNAYIFPGVGLGVLASESRLVTDKMFLVSARALSALVTEEDLAVGRIYPPLQKMREISLHIAVEVAEEAWRTGLARMERPDDVTAYIRSLMYDPVYKVYA